MAPGESAMISTSVLQLRRRWIFGCLSILMMALIFWFSAMPGKESAAMSGQVTQVAVQAVYPDYSSLPRQEKAGAYRLMEHLVRKSAHLTEYAVLGALLTLFFSTFTFKGRFLAALICAALYAASDEWHQAFVADRGPLLNDVLIDTAGASLGVILALLLVLAFRKKRT